MYYIDYSSSLIYYSYISGVPYWTRKYSTHINFLSFVCGVEFTVGHIISHIYIGIIAISYLFKTHWSQWLLLVLLTVLYRGSCRPKQPSFVCFILGVCI